MAGVYCIVLLGFLLSSIGICLSTGINVSENIESVTTCYRCKSKDIVNRKVTEGDSSLKEKTEDLQGNGKNVLTKRRFLSHLYLARLFTRISSLDECDSSRNPVGQISACCRALAREKSTCCRALAREKSTCCRALARETSTCCRDLARETSTSYEEPRGDMCSRDEQPPFGSPSSETGNRFSNLDPTAEEPVLSGFDKRTIMISVCGLIAVVIVVTLCIVTIRRRHPHRKDCLDDRPTVSINVTSDERSPREEPCKEETEQEAGPHDTPVVEPTCASVATQAVQPEAQPELSRPLFLSDFTDDDPGAYMRSLHCAEIARIYRNAVTPMLQSHVISGGLTEEASVELLERHVTETRDLADDWMGRWQRGVSDTLSLSDVWVTLLSMRKAALLAEVQGLAGKARRMA